jgi:cobalt-zinc-cadmium efflux system outer membrane protein
MNFMYLILLFSWSVASYSMTINEITTIATERSSSLTAQEMEAHALQSESNLKGKWQNPQITGQFGSLKSGSIRGSTIEVSVTQPIPLSDKYSLRKEIASVALDNQKKQTAFFKEWVAHQSVLATWKVYVASELLKHGQERTKRIGLVKKYLETRPKVTIRQRVELSIISSTLVQLERMQDLKKHEYEIAKSDLEFWLGKSLSESEIPFHLPDQYTFISDRQLDTTKDIELAHAKNTAKLAQIDLELASKERRPDLFLGGGYRVENVTPENHFSYAIVGLNIPLWDTGSNRLDAAKVREKRDQKNLEETEKRLILKHQKQIDLVKYSIEQLKRFPKKFIQQNENAIHEAEVGFRQGLLDVNTFILAETQSHEVIDQVYISWVNYLENLSTLQLMNGEKLNWEK